MAAVGVLAHELMLYVFVFCVLCADAAVHRHLPTTFGLVREQQYLLGVYQQHVEDLLSHLTEACSVRPQLGQGEGLRWPLSGLV